MLPGGGIQNPLAGMAILKDLETTAEEVLRKPKNQLLPSKRGDVHFVLTLIVLGALLFLLLLISMKCCCHFCCCCCCRHRPTHPSRSQTTTPPGPRQVPIRTPRD